MTTHGPDVELRIERTGRGPEIREVIVTEACPTCAADWTAAGSTRLGSGGGQTPREVFCWGCRKWHRAVEMS